MDPELSPTAAESAPAASVVIVQILLARAAVVRAFVVQHVDAAAEVRQL